MDPIPWTLPNTAEGGAAAEEFWMGQRYKGYSEQRTRLDRESEAWVLGAELCVLGRA